LFEIEGKELTHRPEEDAEMWLLILDVQNYKLQISHKKKL